MAIVVFMDGVIRTDKKVPIYEGISLYKALNANGTVLFAVDDEAEAVRWCKQHNLDGIDGFISDATVGNPLDKDVVKVRHQRSKDILHFVVTADMALSEKLLAEGVRTLLFLHPIYLSAKFRPDGREGRRSWDAIVGELDRQVNMKLEDGRL